MWVLGIDYNYNVAIHVLLFIYKKECFVEIPKLNTQQ